MECRESVHPPAPALSPTFKECADRYIWEHENQWTNKKHAQQWRNTLGTYVYPVIGDIAVHDVSLDQVLFILRTGWLEKAETFRRVRNRMELILDWASKKKLRTGENPARWRANLDQYLARQERSSRSSHAHLPPDQLPELMKTLHRMPGISPLCVSFIALTLCKTRQARFATLDEIDFANKIWTIPYERNYQSERSWELPLSDEAMRVLMKTRECSRDQNNVLLFPAPRGGELSDGLSAVFKRINMKVTADGFRTTFRKWCQQSNRCSDLVINEALGFKRSKKHSDDANKELKINVRRLLEEWGAFCMSGIAEEKTETTWRRSVYQKFERITDEAPCDKGAS